MSRVVLVLALGIAALIAACADDATLTCVDDVDFATCQPLYAPTWANVYDNTIVRSCSTGGRACHAAAGAQGDLVLEGSDRAYASLTTNHAYVTPGEAACSPMIERIYSRSPSLLMPRGARLPDPEACAVAKWVAAGAPGPIDAGVDATVTGASP